MRNDLIQDLRTYVRQKYLFICLLSLGSSCLLASGCTTLDKETVSKNSYEQHQLQCMAEAIHGEARGESEEGKLFVGRVILTRVKEGYGQNYCSVVYAKRQFAPKKGPSKRSLAAAIKSQKLGPNGITHFHSYKTQRTPLAQFSRSPQCVSRGKVGGHWGFTCPGLHSTLSRKDNIKTADQIAEHSENDE